jgi:2-methylisocitrate lyase-like PEP mutase family enzyme
MAHDLAAQFKALHQQDLLILPNVWDAGSARLMVSLGAKAIATTSSGLSWAHGYPDGDHLPVSVHVEAIRQIARVVSVPITVDVESGYSSEPAQVSEHVARFMGAGAVGVNLEDGAATPELTCRKIAAIKAIAAREKVDLFINLRTDVYLARLTPGHEVAETLRRARLYADAGADGLFAPRIAPADIQSVVTGQPLPLNVMATADLPPLEVLRTLGVRRLSAGGSLYEKLFTLAQGMGQRFLTHGATADLFEGSLGFAGIDRLFQ